MAQNPSFVGHQSNGPGSRNPFRIGSGSNPVTPISYNRFQLPGQAASPSSSYMYQDPRIRQIQPLLEDPQASAAIAQMTQYGEESPQGKAAKQILEGRQRALNVQLPDNAMWGVSSDGRIGFRYRDILNDYVAPIATIGASALIGGGLLSGVGGVGGGAGSTGGAPSLIAPNAATAATGAGGAAGAAAPGFVSSSVAGTAGGIGGGAAAGAGAPSLIAGMSLPELISTGSAVAGSVGAGRQAGRDQANQTALTADQVANDRYRTQLEALRYDDERRGGLANDALRGSYLQNVQDVNITAPDGIRMGTVTGGARPSLLTNRGAVGGDLERKAMLDLLKSQPAGPAPAVPQPTPMQEPNWVDTALGIADMAGAGYDTYRDMRRRRPTQGASQVS